MFGTLFSDLFVIVLPGDTLLPIPKATETPSRGPLAPLYGGKGAHCGGYVTVSPDPQELSKHIYNHVRYAVFSFLMSSFL